ncbi:MAG: hypothetical protein KFF68_17855 [Desulfosarcina sp.]|nr:hypothetical protein [Desulfosarcina sp.]
MAVALASTVVCRSKAKIPLIGAAVNLQLCRFARSAKLAIALALLEMHPALRQD